MINNVCFGNTKGGDTVNSSETNMENNKEEIGRASCRERVYSYV